jgi:hypothetical protein
VLDAAGGYNCTLVAANWPLVTWDPAARGGKGSLGLDRGAERGARCATTLPGCRVRQGAVCYHDFNVSAIRISTASESAFILAITWPR